MASIESLSEFAQLRMVGQESVVAIDSTQSTVPIAKFLRQSGLDAYATSTQLRALSETRIAKPSSSLSRLDDPLASQPSVIADLIQADFGSRVYYAVQPDYNTHGRQLNDHRQLLSSLSSSVAGFFQEGVRWPFRFEPARPFEDISKSMIGDMVDRLFGGTREQLLLRMFDGGKMTHKERQALENLLKENKP